MRRGGANMHGDWRHRIKFSLEELALMVEEDTDLCALHHLALLLPFAAPVKRWELGAIQFLHEHLKEGAIPVLDFISRWPVEDVHPGAVLRQTARLAPPPEVAAALKVLAASMDTALHLAFRLAERLVERFDGADRDHLAGQIRIAIEREEPNLTLGALARTLEPRAPEVDTGVELRVLITFPSAGRSVPAEDLTRELEHRGARVSLWPLSEETFQASREELAEEMAGSDYLISLLTEDARGQGWIGEQCAMARAAHKRFYAVQYPAGLSLPSLPHALRDAYAYDPRYGAGQLLDDISTGRLSRSVAHMVPAATPFSVRRPEPAAALKALLLDTPTPPGGAGPPPWVALAGAEGMGKTDLAIAVCADPQVQDRYCDGILWASLGPRPRPFARVVESLVERISGRRPHLGSHTAAENALARHFRHKAYLLVLDDVRSVDDVARFIGSGPDCRRLVIVRDRRILPPARPCVELDRPGLPEACAMLAGTALDDAGDPRRLEPIAEALDRHPLLMAVARGVLASRIEAGTPQDGAIDAVGARLAESLQGCGGEDPHACTPAVTDLGLCEFPPEDREHYFELALFPEGEAVPATVVTRLWRTTGGLTEAEAQGLAQRLNRLCLLDLAGTTRATVRMHDRFRPYAMERLAGRLAVLNGRFLNGFGIRQWSELPIDELYMWRNLAWHLIAAERTGELADTASDPWFLARKCVHVSPNAARRDLHQATAARPDSVALAALAALLDGSLALLARCRSIAEAATTLDCHARGTRALAGFTARLEERLPLPRIVAEHPLPDSHPERGRGLGPGTAVTCCAVPGDGGFVVAASEDGSMAAYDTGTLEPRPAPPGLGASVTACAVDPAGRWVACGALDGTVRVWDPATGSTRFTQRGHSKKVTACLVAGGGGFFVTTSWDGKVGIWDPAGATPPRLLAGHEDSVNGGAIAPDGSFIASVASDGTVRLWDPASGDCLRCLTGHTSWVVDCAVAPDSSFLVSASFDGALRVWDPASGRCTRVLSGHASWVTSCALMASGSRVLSVAMDETARIWDTGSGATLGVLSGHADEISACALSPDERFLITGSEDHTVRLWRTDTGHCQSTLYLKGTILDARWLPDGRRLAAAGERGVYVLGIRE